MKWIAVQPDEINSPSSAKPVLPPLRRLIPFAVLLPAAVAASNQLLFEMAFAPWLRTILYPWLTFTTAVLCWCVGRYLQPAWLQWLVLAWGLALLDLLTMAGSQGGRVEDHFAYVLISAQISLVVLWAILAPVRWQWRLPAVLPAAAAVIILTISFDDDWGWNALMLLTSVLVALLCGGLRFLGFALHSQFATRGSIVNSNLQSYQFGLRHMLVWSAAMVPLLLVVRGLDFFVISTLGRGGIFAAGMLATSVATLNLIAIWSVLGGGPWIVRLLLLLLLPLFVALGFTYYSMWLHSQYGRWNGPPIINTLIDMENHWFSWFWLNAALLAALLLFLRAKGYRLMRRQSPT